MDWRREDVGVMGERNERIISRSASDDLAAGIMYVRFVVEASKVVPRYLGKEML